jgi:excisionase family DNA binding protein
MSGEDHTAVLIPRIDAGRDRRQAIDGADLPTLTVDDVAKQLSVSAKTVRRELAAGRIGCVRLRRLVRFTQNQVLAYIEAQRSIPCPKNREAESAIDGSPVSASERGSARGTTPMRGKLAALCSALAIVATPHDDSRNRS